MGSTGRPFGPKAAAVHQALGMRPMTRAQVAAEVRLSYADANNAVSRLSASRLVAVVDRRPASAGRPAAVYAATEPTETESAADQLALVFHAMANSGRDDPDPARDDCDAVAIDDDPNRDGQ